MTAIDAWAGFDTSAEAVTALDSCVEEGAAEVSRRGEGEDRNFLVANIVVAGIDSDTRPPIRTTTAPSDSDNSRPVVPRNPTSQRNFLPA